MAILKVARLGHPVLRETSRAVPKLWWKDSQSRQFIDDLVETMHEYHGVGLAAPQVHVPLRVAVIEISPNPRYPEAPNHPLTVLINPTVISLSDALEDDWEGCLSLPDLRGRVPRHATIVVEAMDAEGKSRRISAEGFLARALQHELDHLDGKVYVDRMPDQSSLSYLEEFHRYHAEESES